MNDQPYFILPIIAGLIFAAWWTAPTWRMPWVPQKSDQQICEEKGGYWFSPKRGAICLDRNAVIPLEEVER